MQIESDKAKRHTKSKVSNSVVAISRIRSITSDFVLTLSLSNGKTVTRDFTDFVQTAFGLLSRLRDVNFFKRVRLVDGVLTWPGNIDVNPFWVVYGNDWTKLARLNRVEASIKF